MAITVTREVEFEAAHMLSGYDGGCGSIHGHSYKLKLTISCPESVRQSNNFGFVMDFKNLNKIIKDNVPDHYFMYNKNADNDSVEMQVVNILKANNLRVWEFNDYPSAENMSCELAHKFQTVFDTMYPEYGITVTKLQLWETTNSEATWTLGTDME